MDRPEQPTQENRPDRPGPPGGWRDMMRAGYDYPDDLETLDLRDRRRARKDWRREDHLQRMRWIREQRQAEPSSPVAVIVMICLLAVIVLGIGGGLPRLLGDDDRRREPVGLLTPANHPDDGIPDSTIPGSSPTVPASPHASRPASSDTLPVVSERPAASATAAASQLASTWARVFYTRNPSAESYSELVARAASHTTAEVADSFTAAGDSTYDALKASGGRSRVLSSSVAEPRPGSAPVDTPTRISRLVTITIEVTGRKPGRIVLPLLLSVVQENGRWLISDVTGGTGT